MSWKSKRIFDAELLSQLITMIDDRVQSYVRRGSQASIRGRTTDHTMPNLPRVSRTDILRRIEEDRERVRLLY